MNVLVIGSTGYLDSVVAEHLIDAGHRVIALTRSTTAGPDVRRGDLADPASSAQRRPLILTGSSTSERLATPRPAWPRSPPWPTPCAAPADS